MCRLPKQYPAVPAMTWPPCPALWTSLIRPPVPVVAPLKGATPGGQMGLTVIIWKVPHEEKKGHLSWKWTRCFACPDLSGSCASLQWRWRVSVSAGSHTGWLGMDLLGKHTPAPSLWYHWTHTHFTLSQHEQKHTQTHTHNAVSILPAVVTELDDVVLVAVPLGVHYKTEQSLLLLLPVNLHPTPEEPVTTVLAGSPGYKENIREKKTKHRNGQNMHNTKQLC